MHTRASLRRDFAALGIVPGDKLMLHASIRAVGPVAGGPDQIHLALRDTAGEEGTLLMYAGCPEHVDEVGRGELTPEEEAAILDELPAFDPRTARSARDHGALVEMFRTWPGTIATDHVTRFIAAGRDAEHLTANPPWDWTYGAGSVLEKFMNLGGKIVLLGSDHDAVTFLHHVEHAAAFPDKRVARFRVPVVEDGIRVWREMAEVDSGHGAHVNWPDRYFGQLVDGYLEATGNRGGRVGDAETYVFSARGLFDWAKPRMEALARSGG